MLSYNDFISEGKKATEISGRVMTTNSNPNASINHADDSIEGLRRKLLDVYFEKTNDKEKRVIINKTISTYVYALDKKLRISSDIIEMLADAVGETVEEVQKTLTKETNSYFGEIENHYGTTS